VIAQLTGTLSEKRVQRLTVDVGGVGYDVHVPLSTYYAVGEPGARVQLRIHTHVREDSLQLFGFATTLELTLFEKLLGVNGVGPKVALGVLSGIEPQEFVRAIKGNDLGRLTSIPGVGKKTAERLVIELRDKMPTGVAEPSTAATGPDADVRADVLSALGNLGYQRAAAEKAADRALARSDKRDFEILLRESLKELTR
jgi:Holliday junction DNA helicase RuvA